jgi:hypothetical protein
MSAPTVSVLVCAYRRKEYLEAAVSSALNDGADEVVAVKDWPGELIAGPGVVTLSEDIPGIGAALARGIRLCSSDVIAFLDDDDLINPGRRARIREAFEQDPGLVLFRHGYNEVNEDGTQPLAPAVPQPRMARRIVWDRADRRSLRWVTENHAYGVLSTIAVTRAALLDVLPEISEIECGIDAAIGTLSMQHRGAHLFVPDALINKRSRSTLRLGRPTGSEAAYARTFRRIARSAQIPIARRYARMNSRWATASRIIGARRLGAIHQALHRLEQEP